MTEPKPTALERAALPTDDGRSARSTRDQDVRQRTNNTYDVAPRRANGTGPHMSVRHVAREGEPPATADTNLDVGSGSTEGAVLITGGAGFMGSNIAHMLASAGERVHVFDDLSRPGSETNLEILMRLHPGRIHHTKADVADPGAIGPAIEGAEAVFHLAGQVAVDTSIDDPVHDFRTNVQGTFGVLEALRQRGDEVPLVFASTNKVYGSLPALELEEHSTRVEPRDPQVRERGLDEHTPLDFCSPYGCSKGAADQYVIDYARTYGMPLVAFRMSCIYGPFQHGTEEQGWVAHFVRSAVHDRRVTIYGDGKQVRDVLFASDVAAAFQAARTNARRIRGRAFNIGGGPPNTLSLIELIEHLEHTGWTQPPRFAPPRLGDQRYYVSDTTAFQEATGWRPRVPVDKGLAALEEWIRKRRIANHVHGGANHDEAPDGRGPEAADEPTLVREA